MGISWGYNGGKTLKGKIGEHDDVITIILSGYNREILADMMSI